MLRFGMPALIEIDSLEESAALCRELGLSFIELNMNFPEYQADRLENTDSLIRLAEDAGIYYTIHLDENELAMAGEQVAIDFSEEVQAPETESTQAIEE